MIFRQARINGLVEGKIRRMLQCLGMSGNIFLGTVWLISKVTWKVMESFADSGLSSVGNLPEYDRICIYIYGNFNEENAKPMWILGE